MNFERLITMLEQLAVGYELLGSTSDARQRSGLVVVDTIALSVLMEHGCQVFAGSEGSLSFPRTQYSARERRTALGDFGKLVTLALKAKEGPSWRPPWGAPLITEEQAVVLRVAHQYRNALYHRGRVNRTLLQPLGLIYADTVGQLYTRLLPEGQAFSPVPVPAIERLQELGYDPPPDAHARNARQFEWSTAARVIAGELAGRVVREGDTLEEMLVSDLEGRAGALTDDVAWLTSEGYGADELERALSFSQFWDSIGADKTSDALHKKYLEAAMQQWSTALSEADNDPSPDPKDLAEALLDAETEFFELLRKRRNIFRPKHHLRSPEAFTKRARGIRGSAPHDLLDNYRKIDEELHALEQAVAEIATGWERRIQHEIDVARGK